MRRKRFIALTAVIALACPTFSGSAEPAVELRFAAGTFRPLEGEPRAPDWVPRQHAETSEAGYLYLVAVASRSLGEAERAQIEALGAEILRYIPVHGYMLRVPSGSEPDLKSLPFVEWAGPVPPQFKIAPALAHRAAAPSAPERLRVVLEAGESPGRVSSALEGLAPMARASGPGGAWRIHVTVPKARVQPILGALAVLPEVEAVEPVLPFRYTNQDAVWVHQSFVGPSPQETPIFDEGIFGCGQILGISDSGQDYDLCFFRDAAGSPPVYSCLTVPCPSQPVNSSRRKDIIYYNWSGSSSVGDDDTCPGLFGASGHGTHTSGSIAGDTSPFADCTGFTSPNRNGGDGQAPGAKLVVQEMGDGLEYLNVLGGSLANLAEVAYESGARIHSLSWGGGCEDPFLGCVPGCELPYDSFAQDADRAMWDHPDYLIVASAGNSGGVCPAPVAITTPAIAKNVIAAGSVGHGASADIPSYFSSPGPVFDGRLKPDLAAQGESVVSAGSDAVIGSNNCTSCTLDGTSMSAPTTAGLAALAREYYTAGYLDAGTRNPTAGFAPSGALLKATLIDGAVPPGAASTDPDFASGYGRILLDSTLAFAGGPFSLRVQDEKTGLVTDGVAVHAYDVAAGTPLRATLVWTDFPAALNAATARVNELELEVVDPNGQAWFQTLDAGTGLPSQTSNPADLHDTVNVVERLVFENPAPGRWIFRVRGVDVPMGPQPFALLVRGDLSDCSAPASPAAPLLSTTTPNEVEVSWSGVTGAAGYNVYRSFGACPGGPWVPVALGTTSTSVNDPGVSGEVEYSYFVAAASDSAAACESAPSPCASAVPAGDCFLPPDFDGVAGAQSAGTGTCAVQLSWSPATARCGTDVRYNVYRETSTGFMPSPSNRIARCLGGTDYTDAADLSSGEDYHYIVRAEDATVAHGGACRDGNEESNGQEAVAIPVGPPSVGTWTDDAGDTGAASMSAGSPWSVQPSGGHAGPAVYRADSFDGVCGDLVSPVMSLDAPASGPTLSFATIHDLEYDPFGIFGAEGSVGQVEIATGPAFTNWTRLPLSPGYPALVEFPLNNCVTTANLTTYFSGTNLTYTTYTASLANWGGGEIRFRFHVSGDLLYPGGGWWVDDITVTHALVASSCATEASGPPPVPDGVSVPGNPLSISLSGTDTVLTWDTASCGAAPAVNVYWGALGSFATFTGGACGLPASGSAQLSIPGDAWILVANTDGIDTDGSWSRDGAGNELSYTGSAAVCPATTRHLTNNSCP